MVENRGGVGGRENRKRGDTRGREQQEMEEKKNASKERTTAKPENRGDTEMSLQGVWVPDSSQGTCRGSTSFKAPLPMESNFKCLARSSKR